MGLNFNPTKAYLSVVVWSYDDPSDYIDIYLNPTTLPLITKSVIGKLSPIGWSQNVLQYGHSESSPFKMEFFLTAELIARRGAKIIDLMHYIKWFSSFTLPRELGTAPARLVVLWPNVMSIIVAVEEVSTEISRFTRYLEPKEAKIQVSGMEVRTSFRSAGDLREKGFHYDRTVIQNSGGSGTPLNLGSTKPGSGMGR